MAMAATRAPMELRLSMNFSLVAATRLRRNNHKKADVAEHAKAFHLVDLLVNGSSAVADYPLF